MMGYGASALQYRQREQSMMLTVPETIAEKVRCSGEEWISGKKADLGLCWPLESGNIQAAMFPWAKCELPCGRSRRQTYDGLLSVFGVPPI